MPSTHPRRDEAMRLIEMLEWLMFVCLNAFTRPHKEHNPAYESAMMRLARYGVVCTLQDRKRANRIDQEVHALSLF